MTQHQKIYMSPHMKTKIKWGWWCVLMVAGFMLHDVLLDAYDSLARIARTPGNHSNNRQEKSNKVYPNEVLLEQDKRTQHLASDGQQSMRNIPVDGEVANEIGEEDVSLKEDGPEVQDDENMPPLLIYNRIPKAGSTSIQHLMKNLNVRRHHYDFYSSTIYTHPHVNKSEEEHFAGSLSYLRKLSNRPILYDRHVRYIDFDSLGYKRPMYINIVREPVERLVSNYYFVQEEFHTLCNNKTLDECIASGKKDWQVFLHTTLNFLCGSAPICQTFTEESVAYTKQAVMKRYVIVGILEDVEQFLWALEKLLPQYFIGLSEEYNVEKHGKEKRNRTHRKLPIKEETLKKLQDVMKHHYDLYNFLKMHFYKVIKDIQEGNMGPVSNWDSKANAHNDSREQSNQRSTFLQSLGFKPHELVDGMHKLSEI